MTPDAFYIAVGPDRFMPTAHTIGPWGPDSQHGGPPASLLGRAVEGIDDRMMHVARITFEILRPVPLVPLGVSTSIARQGRNVQLVDAALTADGETIMLARAWRIRSERLHGLEPVSASSPRPDPPEKGLAPEPFPFTTDQHYVAAMDWRFVRGAWLERGPATAWARMRYPLIEGEDVSPLTRVLILSDSGSGISATLDFTRWIFINPDLTVYLHRDPRDEWVCLQAATSVHPDGHGMTSARIFDRDGHIGHSAQSLFVTGR